MKAGKILNLHAVVSSSRVNGPGERLVVFFQGCLKRCPGCFNPETHPVEKRELYAVEEVFERHLIPGVEGLTVSGGEPFLQVAGLYGLLKSARLGHGLTTVVYTGFTLEEISASPESSRCLEYADVLVDGGFEADKVEKTLLARGSTNQRLWFLSGRYGVNDLCLPAKAEVRISKDGGVSATGFRRVPLC